MNQQTISKIQILARFCIAYKTDRSANFSVLNKRTAHLMKLTGGSRKEAWATATADLDGLCVKCALLVKQLKMKGVRL